MTRLTAFGRGVGGNGIWVASATLASNAFSTQSALATRTRHRHPVPSKTGGRGTRPLSRGIHPPDEERRCAMVIATGPARTRFSQPRPTQTRTRHRHPVPSKTGGRGTRPRDGHVRVRLAGRYLIPGDSVFRIVLGVPGNEFPVLMAFGRSSSGRGVVALRAFLIPGIEIPVPWPSADRPPDEALLRCARFLSPCHE